MHYDLDYSKIIGVSIFLEQSSTRVFVGLLEENKGKYCFTYDSHYLNYKKAIPLGPELPLSQKYFESEEIFPSFTDRIPSKNNPEYTNYCRQFGINPDEEDILILLSTIGKRGPSSFMFEPKWDDLFSSEDLKEFRNKLGLSTRDFAEAFGITQPTIVRIENKQTSGSEVLKLLDIMYKFPEVAVYYIEKYGAALHSKEKEKLIEMLKSQQFGCWSNILTDREYTFSKQAGEILRGVPWALKMLQEDKVKRALEHEFYPYEQLIGTTKSALFEVRFARALYESNLVVKYEYKTGVGSSSVDFSVQKEGENQAKWFIELTSLLKSEAIKESTQKHQNSSSHSSSTAYENRWNSAEVRDIIKVQQAILNKVTDKNGKPIKFPKIDEGKNKPSSFNVIIVDIRTFNMGISDVGDYINFLFGNEKFPDEYKRYWDKDGQKELIRGLLDENHPDPRSKILKENIHAIGFVKEKNYTLGEISSVIKLYANPRFMSHEEIRKLWPLQSDPKPQK